MTSRSEPRYGIVADIHGNVQAFEAVLAHLDEAGIDAIYCLGDVVGYGGDPRACVALVRERCAATVRGNHDHAVYDPSLRREFNDHARRAIERQADILDDEEKAWLAGLPPVLEVGEISLGHGGFEDPEAYTYVTRAHHAAVELRALRTRWGFLGHTHVPAAWRLKPEGGIETLLLTSPPVRAPGGGARHAAFTTLPLPGPGRILVNPGAVGQPRDRDPRAACAILDTGSATLEHARLPYDIAGAQEAIRRNGLPIFEAGRLAQGI
ncbi:MAG TPA: metallophosphoesterase family protein [Gemmatimonadota bacterium]|nr:metallophosphoesterase family protein [Gemmatimonadota bacterium]